MSPPRAVDDPTTGELRFLDAANACQASQAELRGDMTEIKAALARLEVHASTIATMAAGLNKIGAWLTGWTWKGGLCLLLALVMPWIVGIGGTMILAGQAPEIAALIHAGPTTTNTTVMQTSPAPAP